MRSLERRPTASLRLDRIDPETVLDEYEVPRLFTVRTPDNQLLLAYHYDEDRGVVRYLLVPTDQHIVAGLQSGQFPVLDSLLGRGWMWTADVDADGRTSDISSVEPSAIPISTLPKPFARLSSLDPALLRVRMVGHGLERVIPASVVKRAVEGATGAIRILIGHCLRIGTVSGRPTDAFRAYYDLPVTDLRFGSFEVAFGAPVGQAELQLEERSTFDKVRDLLRSGLDWAAQDAAEANLQSSFFTNERRDDQAAIVEALARLAPPQAGPVEAVEVSGRLTGRRRRPVLLSRHSAERITAARRVLVPEQRERTYSGFVTELDKDKGTFMLRDSQATTLTTVSYGNSQADEVLFAFESGRLVTIVIYEAVSPHELISLTDG